MRTDLNAHLSWTSALSLFVFVLLSALSPALLNAQATDVSSSYTFYPLRIGGGGFVTGIVTHPTAANLVYARTDTSGAYKWNETSQTWTELLRSSNVPSPNLGGTADYKVESIAISKQNSNVLYVAVGEDANGRILKSADQGATWTDSGQRWLINGNGEYRQGSERLAVDPANDSIVYFGSRTQGLWTSNNAGGSWTQISSNTIPFGSNSGGDQAGIEFVTFDPNSGTTNGATNTVYLGVAGSGIWRTTNAGANWNRILYAASIPYDGKVAADGSFWASFTASETNGSLQRYVPSTNSWTNVSPNGGNTWSIALDPFSAARVIAAPAGTSNGNLFRSTTTGSAWDTLDITLSSSSAPWVTTTDEYEYISIASLQFDSTVQNRLWLPEGLGAFRTNDETGTGLTFTNVSIGIENPIGNEVIAPNGVALTAIYDREGFYHTDPAQPPARTYIDTIGNPSPQLYGGTGLDWSGGNTQFIALAETLNNGAPEPRGGYSTNGGQSWTTFAANPASGAGGNIGVSATNTSNIVWLPAGTNFGYGNVPYYTTNQGASWIASTGIAASTDSGNPYHTNIFYFIGNKKALAADKVTGGKFYAITYDNNGTFYVSTDNGATFQQAPYSAVCSINDDCHVFGQIRAVPGMANNVWSTDPKGGLYYTTNAGQTAWTKVANVNLCYAVGFGKTATGASYPTVFIAGTVGSQRGIFRSTDRGTSWQYLTDNPLGIYNQVEAIDGDLTSSTKVYVGWNGNGFSYGDGNPSGGTATQDQVVSASFPSSVTSTGSATVSVQYTTTTSRTLHVVLWDADFNFKGEVFQPVSGSGTVSITVPDNSSITTATAQMRVDLTDGTNVLSSAANYSIPVGSAAVTDTITSVSWPASVTADGSASAMVSYSAGSGRTLTVYLWDSNYNWRGQTSQTVSGTGTAQITVTDNSSITTSVAYMRAVLTNGSTTLDTANNFSIPVR